MAIGLGPVAYIVDHDPRWPILYGKERERILAAIGPWVTGIEHVGSTAVPGLAAKPILDILIGLRTLDDAPECIPRLEAIGYEYVPEYERDMPDRRYFRKGPVENRTHHIHMVVRDGPFWRDHVAFRDYLRSHPDEARQYEALKRELIARHYGDRDAYTDGKASFIRTVLDKARRVT